MKDNEIKTIVDLIDKEIDNFEDVFKRTLNPHWQTRIKELKEIKSKMSKNKIILKWILSIAILFTSSLAFSQGAVVLKKNDYCPNNEWFSIRGRANEGLYIYVGDSRSVEEELERVLEYYEVSTDSFTKDEYDWIKYEFDTGNGRTVVVEVTTLDLVYMQKTIYLKIFK